MLALGQLFKCTCEQSVMNVCLMITKYFIYYSKCNNVHWYSSCITFNKIFWYVSNVWLA